MGVVPNTLDCTISATPSRIDSLLTDVNRILDCKYQRHFHFKTIASVCGKIISLRNCAGNVSRLMTRHMHALINSAFHWNSQVDVNKDVVDELVFWKNNVCSLNGIPIWPKKRAPSRIVYSDALDSGCGSIIETGGQLFHQNWSEFESAKSSPSRELLAVLLALKSFVNTLKAQTVLWLTDNQNVTRIVSCGSKSKEVQDIALDIFSICVRNGISLDVQWIP